jgi:hypothetical protein
MKMKSFSRLTGQRDEGRRREREETRSSHNIDLKIEEFKNALQGFATKLANVHS